MGLAIFPAPRSYIGSKEVISDLVASYSSNETVKIRFSSAVLNDNFIQAELGHSMR